MYIKNLIAANLLRGSRGGRDDGGEIREGFLEEGLLEDDRSSPGREVGKQAIPGSVDGTHKYTEAWKCKGVFQKQGRLDVGKVDRG